MQNNSFLFSSSLFLVIGNSLVLSACFSSIYYSDLDFHNIDTPLFLKFLALTASILYLLLSAGMKRLKVDEDGVEFLYYLRPFARRYRYEYGDVKKVYFEGISCGGAFPWFYIKTKRKHPFLFFKHKYLFFIPKHFKQTKEIFRLLKAKEIFIDVRALEETKKFLDT